MSPGGASLARLYTPDRHGIPEMVFLKHGSEDCITVTPQCRALYEGVSSTLDEHDTRSYPTDLDLMREMPRSGEHACQNSLAELRKPSMDMDPKEWRPNPRDWKMADAISWLEEQKIPRQSIEVCRENGIDGPFLMHILASENRQQILEEVFNVTCPLQRESIIYRMKSLCENCDFEKASKIENSQGDAILRNIRTLLMREASVQIPKYPLRMLAGQLPNIEEWKTFMNSIAMWAGIESSGYARLVQSVHEDPSHEVDAELYVKFSEAQHHIDQRLGLWLYETCPESMKKYMIRLSSAPEKRARGLPCPDIDMLGRMCHYVKL